MAFAQSTNAHKVRQAEAARLLGVKRQSVNELVKRGVIPIDKDGFIDIELAKAALLERVNPNAKSAIAAGSGTLPAAAAATPPPDHYQGNTPVPDSAVSYHVAKALRESAEAQIARLKLAEMRGEVVQKVAVDKAAFEAARALRDGLMNCARRLGATVSVLRTPDECTAAIEHEHRTLLQSWAKTMGLAAPVAVEESAP